MTIDSKERYIYDTSISIAATIMDAVASLEIDGSSAAPMKAGLDAIQQLLDIAGTAQVLEHREKLNERDDYDED